MIGRLAALILLSTLYPIQAAEDPQQISLIVRELGGNVSLQCPFSGKEGQFFHWYKLPLGYMVQTVVTGAYGQQNFGAQFDNPRFKLTKQEDHYLLTIRNISKDDEATYFCQSGTAYSPSFVQGFFLAVNDRNQQKCVNMKQTPGTTSVKLGDPVTLQCSVLYENKEKKQEKKRVQCPGEHGVYWFRAGSGESPPAIIYTHSNRSEEEKERSCTYSLSKTIRHSADSGTYYCAVVACGEILFGGGTKVETRSELDPVVLALGVLLACCVIVITLLIIYVNRRRVCEHCKAEGKNASQNPEHDNSTMDQSADLDGDAEVVNYAALDFSTRRVKRVKKNRQSPEDCVYAAVRGGYHTQHHPSL